MGPKPSQPQTAELFRPRLDEQVNMKHPLVRLAALIEWTEIERTFAVSFTSGRGRPALPPRLVAGLLYLHPHCSLLRSLNSALLQIQDVRKP